MKVPLRNLQLSILDLALEVRRICDCFEIPYFLIGGSLLGAIRHQGFIPWDDDMDIGMLRKDYERFLKVAPSELDPAYFIQTHETDAHYAFPYAKIRINGTRQVENYSEQSLQHSGIFLDIFPYDKLPNRKIAQEVVYTTLKCLKWAGLGKTDYHFQNVKKNFFSRLMKFLTYPLSLQQILEIEYQVSIYSNKLESGLAVNWGGAYRFDREAVPYENLRHLQSVTYEGYKFTVPSHPERFLSHVYGDFRKLPPESQRGKQHALVEVSLGKYRIKNRRYIHKMN